MNTELTSTQELILKQIRRFIDKNSFPPTRTELARSMGFKSANAIEEQLQKLAHKNAITLIPKISRGIILK